MSVASDRGIGSVADELEALSARVDSAKAGAEARSQAIADEAQQIQAASPTPSSDSRVPGWRPTRRHLLVALALALVLLGAAVTVIATRDHGSGNRVSNSTPAANGAVAVDRRLPSETAVSAENPSTPAAPGPISQGTPPPTASPAEPRTSADNEITTDMAKTAVVAAGDSFWSIAEHQVASALGRAPTTAEVAGYWTQLVDANQGRLVHPGNPNLIYAGQTFALP